jgi:hypothetical protein
MTLVKVYQVREALDKETDRGGSVSLGYFLNYEDAVKMAEGKGPRESSGTIIAHHMLTEDGYQGYLVQSVTTIRAASSVKDALRTSALNKLTQAEREALGLV